MVGIDLSPEMIRLASAARPDLRFVVGNLRCLPLPDASLAAAIAFYSLIHFERDDDLRAACREIARVLAPGGEVVVAYHRGNRVVRPGEMWGDPVDLGFRFLPDRTVTAALTDAGLAVTAEIHREPHPGVEHPSRRLPTAITRCSQALPARLAARRLSGCHTVERCRRPASPPSRTGQPAVSVWRAMPPFALSSRSGDTRVGVLANPSGECEPELLLIEAWARDVGVDVVDLGTSADAGSLPGDWELVVALGGDGTILRALQLAMANHAAVLGVNFGHVGFLADSRGEDLATALERIARGEAQVDERTALVATLEGEPPQRMIAFNDVVVTRVPGFGTARLRVEIDGQAMLTLSGDGVVIASPTGSTAYTLGAGGPAVAPTLDAIVLTPLASQGSPLRSLVADGSDTVRVMREPSSAPLTIEVDGRMTVEVPASASLEVRAAPRKARLVRTRPRTFYADLADHL